jgi:hypothetical protein
MSRTDPSTQSRLGTRGADPRGSMMHLKMGLNRKWPLRTLGTKTSRLCASLTRRFLSASVLALLFIMLLITACIPPPTAPPTPTVLPAVKTIVGHWVYDQGGAIDFCADGTGYIPAFEEGGVPAHTFTYTLSDETHLAFKLNGMPDEFTNALVVGIKIEGDKLTWKNLTTGAETVYTGRQ